MMKLKEMFCLEKGKFSLYFLEIIGVFVKDKILQMCQWKELEMVNIDYLKNK